MRGKKSRGKSSSWQTRNDRIRAKQVIQKVRAGNRKSGLEIEVEAPHGFEELIDDCVREAAKQQRSDLMQVVPFWDWLQKTKPSLPPSALAPFSDCTYRIVFGVYDPLSIAGSLATGGRFNVGGSQQPPAAMLPGIAIGGSLYSAESVKCAQAEAGLLGNFKIFKVTPQQSLSLWDLREIVRVLDWPYLQSLVGRQPLGSTWAMQRTPTVSQLLAHYIRMSGQGDGLFYDSAKMEEKLVYSFFVTDDRHAKKIFTCEEVPREEAEQIKLIG